MFFVLDGAVVLPPLCPIQRQHFPRLLPLSRIHIERAAVHRLRQGDVVGVAGVGFVGRGGGAEFNLHIIDICCVLVWYRKRVVFASVYIEVFEFADIFVRQRERHGFCDYLPDSRVRYFCLRVDVEYLLTTDCSQKQTEPRLIGFNFVQAYYFYD